MISCAIPEDLTYIHHQDDEDPQQFGFAYVTYQIFFGRLNDNFAMAQVVALSLLDRDGFNSWPMVCGSMLTSGEHVQFIHPETFHELIRMQHEMLGGTAPVGSTLPAHMMAMLSMEEGLGNGHQATIMDVRTEQ